jgi:hypothetical protein
MLAITGAASRSALRVTVATPLCTAAFVISLFMFASLVDQPAAHECRRLVL